MLGELVGFLSFSANSLGVSVSAFWIVSIGDGRNIDFSQVNLKALVWEDDFNIQPVATAGGLVAHEPTSTTLVEICVVLRYA